MKNRAWIVLVGFLAAATFLLWEDHQAHILSVLPWAILLVCPVLHLFMHRGHGGHEGHGGHGGQKKGGFLAGHDAGHLWYTVLGLRGDPHANPVHLLRTSSSSRVS